MKIEFILLTSLDRWPDIHIEVVIKNGNQNHFQYLELIHFFHCVDVEEKFAASDVFQERNNFRIDVFTFLLN